MAALIRKHCLISLHLLVLTGLLAGPCFGQLIDGTVSNQQADPVENVSLRWTDQRGGTAAAVTDAAGSYQIDLGNVTLVAGTQSAVPAGFALDPNYPNPFNPGTTIPFRVGTEVAPILLSIYNSSGQRIRTLAQGHFSPGRYEIYWDGRDDDGRKVAAGLYIYALHVGAFAQRRKMLLADGATGAGSSGKTALQAAVYSVVLTGEQIVDRVEQVRVDGDSNIDFRADERFLWTRRAPMPTLRQEIAAAVIDDRIYVFGGLDDNANSIDVVEAYAPRTDTWEPRQRLPMPLNHLAAVAAGGRIYIVGGYVNFSRNLIISDQTLEYDPTADSWSRKADMPFGRGAHGAALLNGRIYVVGGIGSPAGEQTRVMIYDPAADFWEVGAHMPVPSEHLAVAAAAGRIYAISGRFGTSLSEVQVYDPVRDTWELRAPIPTARSGITSQSWLGRIFVFGGELPGVFDDNEVYDPVADTWDRAQPMPTARHGLASGIVDGKIYVIGGGTVAGLRATGAVEEYVP